MSFKSKINALPLFSQNLNPSNFGELIDFFGGRRDLKEKTIRVLHSLSFIEDPTRIFRALRFKERFNFRLGKLTKSLIENAVQTNLISALDGRRLFQELLLILEEEEVIEIIEELERYKLLQFFHPKIRFNSHLKRLLQEIKNVISWFKLLFLKEELKQWQVYLLGLTDQLDLQEFKEFFQRMQVDEWQRQLLIVSKEDATNLLEKIITKRSFKNSEIYRLFSPVSAEVLLYLMAKISRQNIRKAISYYFTHLKNVRIHITGDDLKSLGIPQGPIYKKILEDVTDAILDEKVKTKEEEIQYVKDHYRDIFK